LANEFRTIRVPASSANLGPGFDALGMALDIYLTVRFRPAPDLSIRVHGRDADQIPCGADNLIWRIARDLGASSMEMEIDNAIPLGKGLGSSAAAVVAGVVIGAELAKSSWDRARVLDEASRIEGHPDNASASVLGGVTASASGADGSVRSVRMDLPDQFSVAIVAPDFCVPTVKAREALPAAYSRADAIFNVQRAALWMAAISKSDPAALAAAFDDRMHQPYRSALVPGLEEIVALRAPGLIGCALSGAGPAILVLYERGRDHVCDRVREIFLKHGSRAEILHSRVPPCGYMLS
jgi:homoserine kinase